MEDGAPVIIARLTYRSLMQVCHLGSRNTVATGIRAAVNCGWLSVRQSGDPRQPATYILPMLIGAESVPQRYKKCTTDPKGTGSKTVPPYDGVGMDDDVVYPDIDRDKDIHHHKHKAVRILYHHGFTDAVSFVAAHGAERVEAAIAFVESLKGVSNKGALIRRTVERPEPIPEPERPPPPDNGHAVRLNELVAQGMTLKEARRVYNEELRARRTQE